MSDAQQQQAAKTKPKVKKTTTTASGGGGKAAATGKKRRVIKKVTTYLGAPGPDGGSGGDGDGDGDGVVMTVNDDVKQYDELVFHLNSYDRDTFRYPDPADCVLEIPKIENIDQIELIQFELANPRNTIESGYNSRFVFSEYYGGVWHVFAANIPEGTYDAPALADMLTRCMLDAHSVNTTANVKNNYAVTADGSSGRIRISSAPTANDEQVPFQIHCGVGVYSDRASSTSANARSVVIEIKSVDVAADQVTFKRDSTAASRWGPGHLLKFTTKHGTEVVQVVSWNGSVLQLRAGDLSIPFAGQTSLTSVTLSSLQHTDPSLSQILGFDTRDLYDDTYVPLVTVTNPTAIESDGSTSDVTIRIGVEFAMGFGSDWFIRFHNTGTFLDEEEYAVRPIGTTHANVTVDLSRMWLNGLVLSDPNNQSVGVNSANIAFVGTDSDGEMILELTLPGGHSINTSAAQLFLSGFLNSSSAVTADVVSWESGNTVVTLSFSYPWTINMNQFPVTDYTSTSTVPSVQLVNAHGVNLLYLCHNRYDITASRRIALIQASLNDGSIPIGNIRMKDSASSDYFARIQLNGGPLLVQFAQAEVLYGTHRVTVPTKKIENIRVSVFTEEGLPYPLNGLNYSMGLRVKFRNGPVIRMKAQGDDLLA